MEKMPMWTAMCTDPLLSLVTAGVMALLTLTGSTLPRFTGDTTRRMQFRMPMPRLTGRVGVSDFLSAGRDPESPPPLTSSHEGIGIVGHRLGSRGDLDPKLESRKDYVCRLIKSAQIQGDRNPEE